MGVGISNATKKVGAVGIDGNGGNVAVGRVGIAGNGGNVGFGRVGIVGSVSAGGGAAGSVQKCIASQWLLGGLYLVGEGRGRGGVRGGAAGNGGDVGLGRAGIVGVGSASGGADGVSRRYAVKGAHDIAYTAPRRYQIVGAVGREGNGGNVGLGRVGIAGNGGNVDLGRVGIAGNGGLGRVGIVGTVSAGGGAAGVSKRWRAAKDRNYSPAFVSFYFIFGKVRVGAAGRVGNGLDGNGGRVAVGRVDIAGNGGNVVLGRVGIVGSVGAGGEAAGVSKRWRAAKAISVFHNDNATIKDRTKESLKTAMVCLVQNEYPKSFLKYEPNSNCVFCLKNNRY
ncbi:hypothetical protein L1049_023519 [Liquidambar formosana]|uniref:Uncharacterized protein n=1 Tax=Liquidambar formosana TaxID=63359 RepID=A0AAP0X3J2_LIQFO